MKLKGKVLEMWRGPRRKRDKNAHYILYYILYIYILYIILYTLCYIIYKREDVTMKTFTLRNKYALIKLTLN